MSRRAVALLLAFAMLALLPGAASAAPPVAGDDPGTACMNGLFGGSFPIPEDYGQFAFVDGHVCGISYNDSDPDGDPLTYTLVTPPAHGDLEYLFSFDSTVGYTPDPDYFTLPGDVPGGDWASDSFVYQVTAGGETDQATMRFWIAPVNDEPSFTAGSDVAVAEDSGAYSAAWASDIVEGPGEAYQTVSFSVVEYPNNPPGLFAVQPAIDGDGALTFTPAADQAGIARYTVTAKDDGGLESYSGVTLDPPPDDTSDSVELVITVTNGADPVADTFVVDEDTPWLLDVLANDDLGPGDPPVVTSITAPSNGTAEIVDAGASIVYTPTANANGDDAFTYTITGGETAPISITLTPVNDAPTADDDAITVLEDAAATSVPVLVGDADIESDTLTITGKTNGAKGTVVITGGGTGLTYTPGANKSGSDAFTYTISDGNGGADTATVTVTITPVQDDAPNAVNDLATVPTGPAAAIPVLGNDTDLDGDPLTIVSTTNGAHGVVTITGGGSGLTYDPAPLFSGTDTFTYTVFDGFVTDVATVLVTVTPDTAAPALSGLGHGLPAQTLSGSSPRVRLSWAGADPGSGIANYHLQVSVNGGVYTTVTLSSPTATSYERTLSSNTTYRFRLRARDRSGNLSGFTSFQALNPVVLQEGTSLATYTGTWSTSTNVSMSGGKGRFTSSSTRRVSFAFTGKAVGWVTTRTTSSGRAQVYLDGVLVTTIDLDATSTGYRRMVYRSAFATAGRHTIEIRPLGDGRVDIDAFVILR